MIKNGANFRFASFRLLHIDTQIQYQIPIFASHFGEKSTPTDASSNSVELELGVDWPRGLIVEHLVRTRC